MLERTLGPHILVRAIGEEAGLLAYADPAQLEACILNVAINARDAMPRGGSMDIVGYATQVSPAEATETLPAGDYAVLSVTDTGVGMEPERLEKVFDPFFTTKSVAEGSGLGLSMVRRYARDSGGDVRIASAHGRGTRVEIYLPRPGRAATRPHAAAGAHRPARTKGRILLVDDAPDVLITLGAFLEGAGFEVVKARIGDDALRIVASSQALDAIVTDYAMPGISGVDLLLQAFQLRPELPGLMVTGYPGIDDLRELPPRIGVLRKPFLRAELLAQVRTMLEPAGTATVIDNG
jgi:CheY-like chemotaxis protein